MVYADHHALFIQLQLPSPNISSKKRRFKFEECWIYQEGCEDVIKQAWNSTAQGTMMFALWEKIKLCRMALLNWQRKKKKKKKPPIHYSITQLQLKLNYLEEQSEVDNEACTEVRKELSRLLHQEELSWRRRSRVSWLKDGDHNTKFFHAKASQR
jgi:hypothetical protein